MKVNDISPENMRLPNFFELVDTRIWFAGVGVIASGVRLVSLPKFDNNQ
jgi:hypothetical protein